MKYDNKKYIEHLQKMVQFPTVSSADHDLTRTQDFLDMHKYLEEAYPLVHKTMTKEVIGKAGLLFHWKGTGKSKNLPVLVMAHQDVVPEGNVADWKYPPFSGHLDEEGVIWGRGVGDCKNVMQAQLDALEQLIEDGFVPDYDIYCAYGYNEEVMGGPGAAVRAIVDVLKERGVDLGLVLDEGGGPSIEGTPLANVTVGEKGYADYEFFVQDNGGHAAMPPKHNALGKLGYAMWLLEENPMEPFLSPDVATMFKAKAPYTEGRLGELFADPEANWEELKALAATIPSLNCMIRTTTTPTMALGSAQANILPEKASVIANNRILPGQTLEDLEAHFRAVLPEEVQFRLVKGHNPPVVSTLDNVAGRVVEAATKAITPDAIMIPAISFGGTDARYMTEISSVRGVYRYMGGKSNPAKSGGVHAVNERTDTTYLATNVEFFVNVFKMYGDAE